MIKLHNVCKLLHIFFDRSQQIFAAVAATVVGTTIITSSSSTIISYERCKGPVFPTLAFCGYLYNGFHHCLNLQVMVAFLSLPSYPSGC